MENSFPIVSGSTVPEVYLFSTCEIAFLAGLELSLKDWQRARAQQLLRKHSSVSNFTSPKDATEYLDRLWTPTLGGKRRYAYLNALSAQAYLQKGEFPMAVSYTLEALQIAMKIHSIVNITRIAHVYNDLLQTTFSNDPDVIELGLLLIQAQHPHLILKGRSD